VRLDGHHPACRVVGEPEPEAAVDLGLVLRRGAGEHAEQVAEAVHERGELVARQAAAPLSGRPAKLDLGGEPLGLDLGDPGADDPRGRYRPRERRGSGRGGCRTRSTADAPRRLGPGLAGVVGR